MSAQAWKRLEPRLAELGKVAPRKLHALAREADLRPPQLVDNEVRFDPSYHELQRIAREHRVFTDAYHGGSRLSSLALGYLFAQAECGYFCPACMTDGAAYVLGRSGRTADVARLVQDDPHGANEGAMFLTENSGGSDLGASTTLATQGPKGWSLTGDKWFCSNANAEVVLALARMPGGPEGTRGLGLFLVRGDARGLRRVALKEKLGVRSMATAECELRDCEAELLAGIGEGYKAMAEMVNLSRLYNAVTSIAIARRALREGQKNGVWRRAFGKTLSQQPLYQRAVAALAVDVRGALHVTLDCADVFDHADRSLLRALTPLAKAETAKLAVRAASEGCEFLGGNGYVQPWVTERLLRDAQVLPIWEGTSNVQALDFLRALAKDGAYETEWMNWANEAKRADEMSSARLLSRAYHLRAATLLAAQDEPLWAEAYRTRHIERDEAAFDVLVRRDAQALCQWPLL
jgi:alkylation response protein AidB-like acyl-CoA dehydrogenase